MKWHGCGVGARIVRSQRFLGRVGVRFLSTLGIGVGFFCLTLDALLDHFLHHTPNLGIPVEMVQFLLKLLLNQISCCVPQFLLILTAKFHPFQAKELEPKIMETRFWIFYLQLRNPSKWYSM